MNPQILLVDDDETTRDILNRLFERLGVKIATAANPEEALAVLSQGSFSAAILDHQLKGSLGIDLAHRLARQYPGLKLISLSGDVVPDPVFCRHMVKPVRLADLRELLLFLGFS